MELETISIIKFRKCNATTGAAEFDEVNVQVLKGTGLKEQIIAQEIADIEAQQCKKTEKEECYLSVPEWWEIRPEYQRPQLVFVYREKLPNGTWGTNSYALVVPHPIGASPATVSKPPPYIKGNWEGILKLKDNSKIIVNASTKLGVESMIGTMRAYVNPEYLVDSQLKVGERSGKRVFATLKVECWRIDYWAQGMTGNRQATWKKKT